MKSWRNIEGFPDYRVSSEGEIKSCKNNRHGTTDEYHAIRQRVNTNTGYKQAILVNKNGPKTLNVHRVVAQAFIANDRGCRDVNHIDGNKMNNRADNLEWCSHKDNIRHAMDNGLMQPHRLTEEELERGRRMGVEKAVEVRRRPIRIVETGEEFYSIAECARAIGGEVQNIVKCLKGLRHTHKGYHFEYLD